MPHDVFISHASCDLHIAEAVCEHLELAQVKCWIAPRDIQPGAQWGAEITHAIKSSRVLVLVFSSKADQSRQVTNEVVLAANAGLAMLPFRVEQFDLSAEMEYYLCSSEWLDAFDPPVEQHLARLVSDVRALLGSTAAEPS